MKRMKSLYIAGCGLCAALLAAGCSEEALTPSHEYRYDTFMPDPAAQDSTSILRREFYAETGSYLLFNDTLQHRFLGYDYNDNEVYFTEVLDIGYITGATTNTRSMYEYVLLDGLEEQKQALAFLESYVLPHLSSTLKPFSWLLVKDISGEPAGAYDGTRVYPDAVSGERCVAVDCGYVLKNSDESLLEAYTQRVMNIFLSDILLDRWSEFGDFRALSQSYYGGTFEYANEADNTRILREAGFLVKGKNSIGELASGCYPSYEDDLATYITYALLLDDELIEASYGQYPVVMEKFLIYKEILKNLGYVF